GAALTSAQAPPVSSCCAGSCVRAAGSSDIDADSPGLCRRGRGSGGRVVVAPAWGGGPAGPTRGAVVGGICTSSPAGDRVVSVGSSRGCRAGRVMAPGRPWDGVGGRYADGQDTDRSGAGCLDAVPSVSATQRRP